MKLLGIHWNSSELFLGVSPEQHNATNAGQLPEIIQIWYGICQEFLGIHKFF